MISILLLYLEVHVSVLNQDSAQHKEPSFWKQSSVAFWGNTSSYVVVCGWISQRPVLLLKPPMCFNKHALLLSPVLFNLAKHALLFSMQQNSGKQAGQGKLTTWSSFSGSNRELHGTRSKAGATLTHSLQWVQVLEWRLWVPYIAKLAFVGWFRTSIFQYNLTVLETAWWAGFLKPMENPVSPRYFLFPIFLCLFDLFV